MNLVKDVHRLCWRKRLLPLKEANTLSFGATEKDILSVNLIYRRFQKVKLKTHLKNIHWKEECLKSQILHPCSPGTCLPGELHFPYSTMKAQRLLRHSGHATSHRAAEVDILTWCYFCTSEEFKTYEFWRLVPRSQIKADEARQCGMDKINFKEFCKFSACI